MSNVNQPIFTNQLKLHPPRNIIMPIEITNQEENLTPKSQIQPQSLKALVAWLTVAGVDISQWGYGSAKSIENLWDELACGEMYLQNNPLLRVVPVVQVIIRRGDKLLIEAEQQFADQRKRYRNHPPSEKMKPGENHLDTAIRCLREELGVEAEDIEFILASYRQAKKELESPSYPGLWTSYIFHIIEAKVSGLPDTDFWTNEADENLRDVVKKHHWIWQDADDSHIFG